MSAAPGRLVNKADFERLLSTRFWARSAHFAVHHLPASPMPPVRPRATSNPGDLSTGPAPGCPQPVDDLSTAAPAGLWLGCLVPKRQARRAVTRNLLKRQARAAFVRHAERLPRGLWLLRLRQPFSAELYPSAASEALARAVRAELDQLLAR